MVQQEVIKLFNHATSVFKPWKPDTKKTIQRCTENDLLSMNLAKLAKTPEDMAKLTAVIN